ncbi:ABC transporter ATP-binding protein [Ponticoccus litoralis]|uniref:ATP-binding cassette domain-containing protein n=1 Tax=Ponticoccus litoralis TaxID=422297 RepID=A0AAW9SSZ5_9RHOB
MILSLENLSVSYGVGPAVSGITLSVAPDECLALVGASGSGKSTIAQAVLGLHRPQSRVTGRLSIAGQEMAKATEADWAALRGTKVGYVSQDPYSACDPLRGVGHHLREAWHVKGIWPEPGWAEVRLAEVGIAEAPAMADRPPHAWSGGMLQRACIAAAGALTPPLIVADEPTSGLDADRADRILAAIRASGAAILLISHDLGLVRRHADRVMVLDGGRLVDGCAVADLYGQARHPATRRLVQALAAPALPPREATCRTPLLTAKRLCRDHPGGRRIGPVDLTVRTGEVTGLVGASGAGKSTILRLISGQDAPDAGRIDRAAALRRPGAVMPVFQNPAASLNAYWPIWRTVSEPATVSRRVRRSARRDLAADLLARVGLKGADLDARPGEFSLGQCQRIALARAIAAKPLLLIADEPTSALDTVSRAQIADLFAALRDQGIAIVLASHDHWMHDRLEARAVDLN